MHTDNAPPHPSAPPQPLSAGAARPQPSSAGVVLPQPPTIGAIPPQPPSACKALPLSALAGITPSPTVTLKPRLIAAWMLAAALMLLLASCEPPYSPLLSAEPAVDSVQTRVPRTLRLYYDALPDVGRSSLELHGPAGQYRLRGLHTMAADDLMIEILDPLTDGEYEVRWVTTVAGDPAVYEGSYRFSVRKAE